MNTKYVTSLELSKQLKEAGIPQESEWYWMEYEDKEDDTTFWNLKYAPNYKGNDPKDYVSAFHVGELGEMLPRYLDKDGNRYYLEIAATPIYDNKYMWSVSYRNVSVWRDTRDIKLKVYDMPPHLADTEAEARGKMLLYLKKEGLV